MIKITRYTPMDKGALKAFISIEVIKWNLNINDLSLFETGGRRWINFPSKKIDAKDGSDKPTYFPYLKFTDKDTNERFNSAVITALDQYLKENPQHSMPPQYKTQANHNDEVPF